MLRQFSYLNTTLLEQFVSALEDGQIGSRSQTNGTTRKRGLTANARFLGGEASRTTDQEAQRTFADTPSAQFERLVRAAADDPEGLGWVDVTQPDVELAQAGRGTMISWDCEVYTPELVQAFGAGSETGAMLRTLAQMMPTAKTLGLDTSGLPDADTVETMSGFVDAVKIDQVVVGDRDDTAWKVFATVNPEHELDPIDGPLQLVGKVRRIIPTGQWHPLLSMPGSQFGSREQRRAQARQEPADDQKQNFVQGPALELDLLAAYA